jgi:hypothetical protein
MLNATFISNAPYRESLPPTTTFQVLRVEWNGQAVVTYTMTAPNVEAYVLADNMGSLVYDGIFTSALQKAYPNVYLNSGYSASFPSPTGQPTSQPTGQMTGRNALSNAVYKDTIQTRRTSTAEVAHGASGSHKPNAVAINPRDNNIDTGFSRNMHVSYADTTSGQYAEQVVDEPSGLRFRPEEYGERSFPPKHRIISSPQSTSTYQGKFLRRLYSSLCYVCKIEFLLDTYDIIVQSSTMKAMPSVL